MRRYVKLIRATLAASLFLVAAVRVAIAGPLEDSRAAFNRGKTGWIVRHLRVACARPCT
jgi:hypothetical protein